MQRARVLLGKRLRECCELHFGSDGRVVDFRRRDGPSKVAAKAKPTKDVSRVVRIEGGVAVGELARKMGVKAPDVQRKLMALGTMASINQSIDPEVATKLAAEFGFQVQDVGFREEEFFELDDPEEAAAPRVALEP